MNLKSEALKAVSAMLALGLITVGLGFASGNYRGFYLALTLGGIIAASSAIYLVIISMKNAEDLKSVATPTIQSLWISTSMGLGYVVTAYAPYFKYPFTVATALFALGWIILGFGLAELLRISKASGVELAV